MTCAIVASSGLVGFTLLGLIKGFIFSKPPGRRLVNEKLKSLPEFMLKLRIAIFQVIHDIQASWTTAIQVSPSKKATRKLKLKWNQLLSCVEYQL